MLDPILEQIKRLERRYLDGAITVPFETGPLFGTQSFLHIVGLSDFWSTHPEVHFTQYIIDLAISAHCQGNKFLTFVCAGTPQKLSIYLSLGSVEMTQLVIEGLLPGVRWEMDTATAKPKVIIDLAHRLAPHLREKGVISGIPSQKRYNSSSSGNARHQNKADAQNNEPMLSQEGSTETQSIYHLERVVRGMSGATWAYIVRAYPRPRETVVDERLEIIDALANTSSQMRGQVQKTTQTGQSLTASKNSSHTETMGGEMVNYRAQYLVQLLERELMRLDKALAIGQWTVDVHFGTSTIWDTQRLAALLLGTMAGTDSRPDPLRTYLCDVRSDALPIELFKTYLSSEELATLIQLPREEVPGYAMHDLARFDVDFDAPVTSSVELGTIQQNMKDTYDAYRISLDDLTKHAVVIGVTGSGKTTTVLNLLDHTVAASTPFLVIEPVKTEYRALRAALGPTTDVRIYTLGNETIAPFRFNPFEFELDDVPGNGSLLNHIDFLKAVFNAAFILYAPMPYILETALYEVYQDKGWDLSTGKNTRMPDADWRNRHLYPIFPTLTDLYNKVEVVTNRLKYFTEIEQNVKAGLKARIGSLRLGAKGFMLDTPRGIALKDLLSQPTVLELENIGNDDEKTFLMGLFLARLYEYRRLQASQSRLPGGLQHLLVIEEAHRLLKQTTTQVDVESSNPRAQAIETFTNMLSEIRGYGQGVIVAEQIPSKLATDVLKNTNLKIVHRLVAQDDRTSVGQTMNLTAMQTLHLGTLAPGRAAIFAEGIDHAYLVRIENYKSTHKLIPTSDTDLEKASASYASVKFSLAIPHMDTYSIRYTRFHGPDMTTYQNATLVLETEDCKRWWGSVMLCIRYQRNKLLDVLAILPQLITARMLDLQWGQVEALRIMILVRGVSEILNERGAEVGWTFPLIEDLRHHLTRGLLTLSQTGEISRANSDLEYFTRKYHMRLERKQGPFPGCIHCPAKCIYRPEVSRILSSRDVSSIDGHLAKSIASSAPRDFNPVAERAKYLATQWIEGPNPLTSDIAFCAALHAMSYLKVDVREQNWSGESLARILL